MLLSKSAPLRLSLLTAAIVLFLGQAYLAIVYAMPQVHQLSLTLMMPKFECNADFPPNIPNANHG